ncbi:MAG: arginyltransferase [Hyphomicrobiales bacterium]|nr:MAG: arginyltransferase [Hyphomicrobiales bacterium]
MRQGPAFTLCSQPAHEPSRPAQQYYVLTESSCPYLPGRRERKLITELGGGANGVDYSRLSRAGFRRSHTFAYRPACSGCAACVPVRVAARRLAPSPSLRRVARVNAALHAVQHPARATLEQYRLFCRYIGARHDDGEMDGMSFADYRGMVEHTRVDTRMVEFRGDDGRLVAACLSDWLADGTSAVYSFFDPASARLSPGTFMILWLIEATRSAGLDYVYLGYWIDESPKMAYKTRFRPLEAFGPSGWQVLDR